MLSLKDGDGERQTVISVLHNNQMWATLTVMFPFRSLIKSQWQSSRHLYVVMTPAMESKMADLAGNPPLNEWLCYGNSQLIFQWLVVNRQKMV